MNRLIAVLEKILHNHSMEMIGNVRLNIPPGPPSHTKVVLFRCACGQGEAFPASNWNLATEEEQQIVMLEHELLVVKPLP